MKIFDSEITENNSPVKADQLSAMGYLFGFRIVKGEIGKSCSSGYLIQMFIEDDYNWHLKGSFDALWLEDFLITIKQLLPIRTSAIEQVIANYPEWAKTQGYTK